MPSLLLLKLCAIYVILLHHAVAFIYNERPIIAVLAQLAPPDFKRSYIVASYVKYLESAGARVVPIPSSMSTEEASKLFDKVNGVLFPGGGVKWFTSGYYHHAKLFYDRAMEANKKSDYFPMWGTCLGFQTLHVLVANDSKVVTRNVAEDVAMPLEFTSIAFGSRMFRGMDIPLFKSLGAEDITYNHHKNGITPSTYEHTPALNSFFDVLSHNNGTDGHVFVSTVQGKTLPFYGTQWHPEKNNFEYIVKKELNIPHSDTAIAASLYMANFFVEESRKSAHNFSSAEEEEKYLIYNYTPVYTGKYGPEAMQNFEQVYYFD